MKLCRRVSVFPLSISTVQALDFLPFWSRMACDPGESGMRLGSSTSATNFPST